MAHLTPTLINGNAFTDHRGTVRFVNAFDFRNVQRFYSIHHPDKSVIRAWQAHKLEEKYFYASSGAFVIAYLEIDDWITPSKDAKAEYVLLSAGQSAILHIPKGYANGIKALENDSTLITFSTLNIGDAKQDDYRYDAELWLDWTQF